MITIPRINLIPAPIHDLLNSLGTFHSKVTGVNYITVPPARPAANAPAFWDVNYAVLNAFNLAMSRLQFQYTMREFPSLTDVEDRPLLLTEASSYLEEDEQVFVKSWTNEPRPSDALMRIASNQLYDVDPLITYDNCKLTMTQEVTKHTTLVEYIGSYMLQSNS